MDYQKLYELKKAEKLLKKHKLLDKKQGEILNLKSKEYEQLDKTR